MAFDLALIERALQQAVSDAKDALAERWRNYAGYPAVGKFALYEDAVRDAESARTEFAKLRKAMEEASIVEVAPEMRPFRMERIATMVRVEVSPSTSRQRFLLVKADG